MCEAFRNCVAIDANQAEIIMQAVELANERRETVILTGEGYSYIHGTAFDPKTMGKPFACVLPANHEYMAKRCTRAAAKARAAREIAGDLGA